MLLTDAVQQWHRDLARAEHAGTRSPATVARLVRDTNALIALVGEGLTLDDLTVDTLNDAFDTYRDTPDARYKPRPGVTPPGRSPATMQRLYSSLNTFFTQAVRRGWCTRNPLPDTYLAGGNARSSNTDPRRRNIGITGADQLLATTDTLRDEFLVRLLLETGARIGEVCAANHTDLSQAPDGGYWLRLEHTKNGRARMVPLSADTVRLYQRYRAEEMPPPQPRPGKPGSTADSAAALIRTYRGRRLTPRDAQRVMRKLATVSGVDATPHALRHTTATVLLEDNMGVHQVRDLLGHSSIAVTSRYLDGSSVEVAAGVLSGPLVRVRR